MKQFTFEKLEDGNYRLTHIDEETKVLEIPSKYCEALVTEIDEGAFCEEDDEIETIIIPSTIKEINNIEFCFEEWTKLKNITIEDGNIFYKSIDGVLFNNACDLLIKYPRCKESDTYEVPSTVKEICNEAFSYSKFVKNIILPSGLKVIGEGAFAECKNLKNINLPDTLSKIKDVAFINCISLESIYIPCKIKSNLDAGVFQGCKSLSSIIVDENNKKYTSIDGVLYTKDISMLIIYPCGKKNEEFTIPNTIEILLIGCFGGNHFLKKLYIPSSIKEIEDLALDDMKALECIDVDPSNKYFCSVDGVLYNKERTTLIRFPNNKNENEFIVPNGVSRLRESSFKNCSSIKKIILPKSIKTIEDFAISEMPNLEQLETSSEIDNIGMGNFVKCPKLKTQLKSAMPMFEEYEDEEF